MIIKWLFYIAHTIWWYIEEMSDRCGVGKPVEILGGSSGHAGTGTPSEPVGQLELVGLWASWKAPQPSPDQLAGARQVPW